MQNRRYDYVPIIRRKKITWPKDTRIALWVAPNIEFFHFDMPIRGSGSNHAPDVPGYTLRDYGSRVGVFRIMDVLEQFNIRASVLLNAEVCQHHPRNITGWFATTSILSIATARRVAECCVFRFIPLSSAFLTGSNIWRRLWIISVPTTASGGRPGGRSPTGTTVTTMKIRAGTKVRCESRSWSDGVTECWIESARDYFGPSSPVNVTDERTLMVPDSTGVGAAASASICAPR